MNISFKLPATILFILAPFWVSVLTVHATPPQGQKETVQQHLDLAWASIERKDYNMAEKEAKRAQAIEKDSPEAYFLRATIYHRQHKQAEALQAVTNAIAHQSNYPDAHYLKAVLYSESVDLDHASDEIRIALEQGEKFANAFGLAGDLKLATQRIRPAKDAAQFPTDDTPEGNRPFFENVLALYESGVKVASPDDLAIKKLQMRIEAVKDILNHLGEPSSKPHDKLPPGSARIKLLTVPKPVYTNDARDKKEQGMVRVGVFFGADGSIAGAFVMQGLKYGLNEQALRAIYQIKFMPATAESKPISVFKIVRVSFTLF